MAARQSLVALGAAPRTVAGVDLGSNSFHLMVVRAEEDGRIHVLDRLRDPVRLAAGLGPDGALSEEAIARGIATLHRFGERLRNMPHGSVHAVATNTLRKARNGAAAEEEFADALGHPIEIISGREEARLIYNGVSHATPEVNGRLLVLDIGGGSTECIIGRGFDPIVVDSLYMGCVGFTARYFGDGKLTPESFELARLAAGLELAPIVERYHDVGWDTALGSSGTVQAVHEVLRRNGWSRSGIDLDGLRRLEQALCECGKVARLSLDGLDADRAPVFAGGVAILMAAFEYLGIETMAPAAGALREGLVYELLGRVTEGDPRDATVARLARRYKVDRRHASRVATTAHTLFEQGNASWGHEPERAQRLLEQAATLHEIGLAIAYTGHHKHGAYLLRNGDMPGFSIDEQQLLAAVVGAHRRRLATRAFEALPGDDGELALHLAVVLRLAVQLHHGRGEAPSPPVRLRVRKRGLELKFPAGWLATRPLTRAYLDKETEQLGRIGIALRLREPPTG